MSLETLLQTFSESGIQSEVIDGKFSSLLMSSDSTLSDSEAWDLIDSEDLRYVASEPEPTPDPNYIEWRKAAVMLPEFQAITNEIFAVNQAFASSILIAYAKVSDRESLQTAIELWNIGISLISITPEQAAAIQTVCDAHHVPMSIADNGEASYA